MGHVKVASVVADKVNVKGVSVMADRASVKVRDSGVSVMDDKASVKAPDSAVKAVDDKTRDSAGKAVADKTHASEDSVAVKANVKANVKVRDPAVRARNSADSVAVKVPRFVLPW